MKFKSPFQWFAWQITMLITHIRIFVVADYYGLIEPKESADEQQPCRLYQRNPIAFVLPDREYLRVLISNLAKRAEKIKARYEGGCR